MWPFSEAGLWVDKIISFACDMGVPVTASEPTKGDVMSEMVTSVHPLIMDTESVKLLYTAGGPRK